MKRVGVIYRQERREECSLITRNDTDRAESAKSDMSEMD